VTELPAVQAIGLTRVFRGPGGQVTAVNRVSLSVRPGEFVSLVGHSGSGKTTLLYCLSALDQATSGVVMLGGKLFYDASQRIPEDALTERRLQNIGFIFQSYHLLSCLTALENVMVPLRLAGYGRREAATRARETLAEVDMDYRADHFPHQLSGGEQQRVAVARALVNRPRVLLADEPTGNLDYDNGLRVVALLRELSRRHQTAVIMVSHVRDHAEQADRMLTMRAGELLAAGGGGE
jgi:putative ABC transport system ATP-binding protein